MVEGRGEMFRGWNRGAPPTRGGGGKVWQEIWRGSRNSLPPCNALQAVCVAIDYLSLHLCNGDLLPMIMRGWKYRGGTGGGRPRVPEISNSLFD